MRSMGGSFRFFKTVSGVRLIPCGGKSFPRTLVRVDCVKAGRLGFAIASQQVPSNVQVGPGVRVFKKLTGRPNGAVVRDHFMTYSTSHTVHGCSGST